MYHLVFKKKCNYMYNALTLTGKSLLLKEFSFYVNVIILLNKILKIKKKAFEC